MKFWTRRALLALCSGLCAVPDAWSQNAPTGVEVADDEEQSVIKGGTELVNVMATVRDKNTNALAKGLKAADFKIFEDGKEQPIRDVAIETNLPLMLGMLIDISSSMDIYIPEEKQAGAKFFRDVLRPKDKAFVADFRAGLEMLQDVTSKPERLEAGLGEMTYDKAQAIGTALYDAIYFSCRDRLNGQNERKVLVVLSDGADYGSSRSLNDAVEMAQKTETMIYAIAYPLELNPRMAGGGFGGGAVGRGGRGGGGGGFGGGGLNMPVNDRKTAENIMRTLAEDTGGRLFTKPTAAHLDDIYKEIQDEVRSQYAISYAPPNAAKRDGKFRKIEVRAVNKEYKVQARKGYYATAAPAK